MNMSTLPTHHRQDRMSDRRGNRGPWWVTDVIVPTVLVLTFLLAYALACTWIGE